MAPPVRDWLENHQAAGLYRAVVVGAAIVGAASTVDLSTPNDASPLVPEERAPFEDVYEPMGEGPRHGAPRLSASPDAAVLPSPVTFKDFVETRYLPHARVIKRGIVSEISILNNHSLPALGHRPLHDIKKAEIMAFLHSKLSSLKPGTINRILNGLKVIFSRAMEWEVPSLVKDPTKGIKQFANMSRHERYLSQEEANRLMQAVMTSHNPMLYPIVAALLLTGSRKREILDARWDYVDLQRGFLIVPLSKNGKPRQVILSEPAKNAFLQAKAILTERMGKAAADRCPFVFANPETGKPFTGIFKSWNAARIAVNLKDLRMHDLRHSFASALVNKGNSLYDVQKLLGHSSSRMTERYAHLSTERLTSVANDVSLHYPMPKPSHGNEMT